VISLFLYDKTGREAILKLEFQTTLKIMPINRALSFFREKQRKLSCTGGHNYTSYKDLSKLYHIFRVTMLESLRLQSALLLAELAPLLLCRTLFMAFKTFS